MDVRTELEELKRLEELESRQISTPRGEKPSGFVQGIMDPVAGAGQLVPRALEQITSIGGLAKNPVSEAYRRNYQNVGDPYSKKREQDYQSKRAAAGEKGFDGGRLLGNIANPVNYIGGAGWAPAIIRGAGYGALQPVTDTENYGTQKTVQVGSGALGSALGKGVSDKLVAPATNAGKQIGALLKEKIPLTPGQMSQGIGRTIENKLISVPVLGDAIKKAQGRSIEGLNKAAYNRALSPIGEKLPNNIEPGRGAISYITEKLSSAYDNLLPKLSGNVDDQFLSDVSKMSNMVQADDVMNALEKGKFNNIVKTVVMPRISPEKGITGEAIKEIESQLGERAAKFGKGSVSEQQLSSAIKELQGSLRKMVERSNPQYAERLSAINKGYANLLRIQKAAGSGAADNGVFTPSQLSSAVKSLDPTKNKRGYATGKALMQDLSDAGRSVLPSNVPNSGTVDRAAVLGLAGAGLYGGGEYTDNPYLKAAALGIAPSLLYTQTGVAANNALARALASKAGQAVAQPIGRVLPYAAGPAFSQIPGK